MTETTLTVLLPASVRRHVEKRAAASGFTSADAYVRALIDEDLCRRAQDELEAQLLAGLDSGEKGPADWAGIRAAAVRFAEADKSRDG